MRFSYLTLMIVAGAQPLAAQSAPHRFESTRDTIQQHEWTALRVGKWAVLASSVGAVTYGFSQSRSADREYEEIEQICVDAPLSCLRTPSDAYADANLEARYQQVVKRDDHARLALLAGQVGIAASVVLFILDLPSRTTPEDVPYNPHPLRFGIVADQVQLVWALRFR